MLVSVKPLIKSLSCTDDKHLKLETEKHFDMPLKWFFFDQLHAQIILGHPFIINKHAEKTWLLMIACHLLKIIYKMKYVRMCLCVSLCVCVLWPQWMHVCVWHTLKNTPVEKCASMAFFAHALTHHSGVKKNIQIKWFKWKLESVENRYHMKSS